MLLKSSGRAWVRWHRSQLFVSGVVPVSIQRLFLRCVRWTIPFKESQLKIKKYGYTCFKLSHLKKNEATDFTFHKRKANNNRISVPAQAERTMTQRGATSGLTVTSWGIISENTS